MSEARLVERAEMLFVDCGNGSLGDDEMRSALESEMAKREWKPDVTRFGIEDSYDHLCAKVRRMWVRCYWLSEGIPSSIL